MLFNIENVKSFIEILKEKLNFEYKHIQYSTLGGKENISIIITVSIENQSLWYNGILQNSKYANFYLSNNGKLELFSKHHNMPKLRKCKIKNITHLIEKLNKYEKSCLVTL